VQAENRSFAIAWDILYIPVSVSHISFTAHEEKSKARLACLKYEKTNFAFIFTPNKGPLLGNIFVSGAHRGVCVCIYPALQLAEISLEINKMHLYLSLAN
jgi:tryptophan-rich sensory protein